MKKKEQQDLGIVGLGDGIKVITEFLGIPQCKSCEKRQLKLNKMFNWLQSKREMTKEEVEFILRMIDIMNNELIITNEERERIFIIYNDVTNSRVKSCVCPGVCKTLLQRLNGFFEDEK